MENSAACCHPLRGTIANDSAATMRILMDERAIHDVRDSLETAMRVPIGALWFVWRVINCSHLIHHDEWVEDALCNASKGTTDREAFAFVASRRCREGKKWAINGVDCWGIEAGEGQSVGGDCGHFSNLSGNVVAGATK
jgi:hypothetical protein